MAGDDDLQPQQHDGKEELHVKQVAPDPASVEHRQEDDVLWRHPDPLSTHMWRFLQHIKAKHDLALDDYSGLYRWSVENVGPFWEEVWHFCGIRASRLFDEVLPPASAMFPRPDFFRGARLNFAENLLYPAPGLVGTVVDDPDAPAVLTVTERFEGMDGATPLGEEPVTTSWDQLRAAVAECAAALRRQLTTVDGSLLSEGKVVVAGFVSNHVQALVAMLASAAIGAVWTSISPDSGVGAVLDRLEQVGPVVLFADNATVYNGKVWSSTEKTERIVASLVKKGLRLAVIIQNVADVDLGIEKLKAEGLDVQEYESFLASARPAEPEFAQLPPSHPLYILYSSGTTGLPKAIVHTALGTLIQHKKEHLLHCDLGGGFVHRNDRLLYYTTTSWMMWHWSVSALAAGCSLVLYSGSPFRPRGLLSMPRLIDELNVTHFGTSAAYLVTLEAKGILLEPSQGTEEPDKPSSPPPNLSRLRAIYSTASPLPPSTFRYVYRAFSSPPDDDGNRSTKSPSLNLASITGGTDIISLFGAPNPLLPVLVGKVQCVGLGMAVAAVDPVTGAPVPRGEEGDLVCTEPFPSMPLTFWVEGGGGVTAQKGQEKYRDAYFARFPGVWHHGDFVRLDGPLPGGAMTMLGRSDGVLKPAGVRFGSAEIYNVLARFFAAEVEDAVCVGRRREGVDKDETVCLFVALRSNEDASGNSKPTLDGPGGLRESIKDVVRRELSPRHVPGIIEECGPLGVPKTSNGKKIEVAVKQILCGMNVKTNAASVANPEALDWFREWVRTH